MAHHRAVPTSVALAMPADKAFPGLVGADGRRDHAAADQFAPGDIGTTSFNCTTSMKKNSSRAFWPCVGARNVQAQQRRRMAQAVDADHQAGLNLGRPFQKPFVIARPGPRARE